MREVYMAQVALLVRLLPIVAEETDFALKGGTAINLFHRDLPRLSVDIDLTYLPIGERAASLAAIDAAMDRIASNVERLVPGAVPRRMPGGGGHETRLLVRLDQAQVKIEVSPVARGTLHAPKAMQTSETVQEQYGYAEIQVVSFEDLYGGKLHAALDRQHPRDLFDIALLYENEGMDDQLLRAFLVYLACSNRPPHELIDPGLPDLDRAYLQEFAGMTRIAVSADGLQATRSRLITDIQSRLDENAADFLLSLHDGQPNFEAIGLPQALDLPAVQWKLKNIQRLVRENPEKHSEQREALEALVRRR